MTREPSVPRLADAVETCGRFLNWSAERSDATVLAWDDVEPLQRHLACPGRVPIPVDTMLDLLNCYLSAAGGWTPRGDQRLLADYITKRLNRIRDAVLDVPLEHAAILACSYNLRLLLARVSSGVSIRNDEQAVCRKFVEHCHGAWNGRSSHIAFLALRVIERDSMLNLSQIDFAADVTPVIVELLAELTSRSPLSLLDSAPLREVAEGVLNADPIIKAGIRKTTNTVISQLVTFTESLLAQRVLTRPAVAPYEEGGIARRCISSIGNRVTLTMSPPGRFEVDLLEALEVLERELFEYSSMPLPSWHEAILKHSRRMLLPHEARFTDCSRHTRMISAAIFNCMCVGLLERSSEAKDAAWRESLAHNAGHVGRTRFSAAEMIFLWLGLESVRRQERNGDLSWTEIVPMLNDDVRPVFTKLLAACPPAYLIEPELRLLLIECAEPPRLLAEFLRGVPAPWLHILSQRIADRILTDSTNDSVPARRMLRAVVGMRAATGGLLVAEVALHLFRVVFADDSSPEDSDGTVNSHNSTSGRSRWLSGSSEEFLHELLLRLVHWRTAPADHAEEEWVVFAFGRVWRELSLVCTSPLRRIDHGPGCSGKSQQVRLFWLRFLERLYDEFELVPDMFDCGDPDYDRTERFAVCLFRTLVTELVHAASAVTEDAHRVTPAEMTWPPWLVSFLEAGSPLRFVFVVHGLVEPIGKDGRFLPAASAFVREGEFQLVSD